MGAGRSRAARRLAEGARAVRARVAGEVARGLEGFEAAMRALDAEAYYREEDARRDAIAAAAEAMDVGGPRERGRAVKL